jgi:hypothetical protein
MTILRVSESGQVYDIDIEEIRVTPDQDGGFYVHGRGHFLFFKTDEEAREKKQEIESRGAYG